MYQDKDYSAEAKFVHSLIQKHALNARTILELGCGSGAHAENLVKEDYQIHGVDLSTKMIEFAQSRLAKMPVKQSTKLSFSQGDIRKVRLEKQFDVAISLFHVMSYQITNADLIMAFITAKAHLKQDSVFIFDCWYGPAVLTDRPTIKIKHVENEIIEVTRLAEPILYINENFVDVNYHVFIRDKTTRSVKEIKETHRMRYLFKPEVELIFQQVGFKLENCLEFMTDKEPGCKSWNVCFIGRKI